MSLYPMVKAALGVERRRARRPRGRVLLPDVPHRYAPELFWPGSCWCSKPEGHPVHSSGSGIRL